MLTFPAWTLNSMINNVILSFHLISTSVLAWLPCPYTGRISEILNSEYKWLFMIFKLFSEHNKHVLHCLFLFYM